MIVREQMLLYTPIQAAQVLGISRTKVYDLLKAGELPSVHIGSARRIQRSALSEFVEGLAHS